MDRIVETTLAFEEFTGVGEYMQLLIRDR